MIDEVLPHPHTVRARAGIIPLITIEVDMGEDASRPLPDACTRNLIDEDLPPPWVKEFEAALYNKRYSSLPVSLAVHFLSVLQISVPFQLESHFIQIMQDEWSEYDTYFMHQDDPPPPTASRLEFTHYICILTDHLLLDLDTYLENKESHIFNLLYRLAGAAPTGAAHRL
jgi:hypothetical protein